MADIIYERLANSIANVKTALDNIVPRFIGNTLTQGQFVEVGIDNKLKTTGFKTPNYATSEEIQQCGAKNPGTSLNIARNDHIHPNTCPTPTESTHIANKYYVDNRLQTSASLGGAPAPLSLVANVPVHLVYNSIKNTAIGNVAVFENYYFQVSKSGRYRVSFFGVYKSSESGNVKAVIAIDNVDTYIGSIGTRLGSSSVTVSEGATGILDLVAGDAVAIKISSTNDTTITHELAGFSIESI